MYDYIILVWGKKHSIKYTVSNSSIFKYFNQTIHELKKRWHFYISIKSNLLMHCTSKSWWCLLAYSCRYFAQCFIGLRYMDRVMLFFDFSLLILTLCSARMVAGIQCYSIQLFILQYKKPQFCFWTLISIQVIVGYWLKVPTLTKYYVLFVLHYI